MSVGPLLCKESVEGGLVVESNNESAAVQRLLQLQETKDC
jgi:hypothetical protein